MKSTKVSKVLLMAIGCLIALLALPTIVGCSGGTKTIGISQVVTHPALDSTRQGVIDALADNGYTSGDNLIINYQNSEGDSSLFGAIAQQFVTNDVSLIVTIATPNSQAAVAAAEGTDIPVVFTAVTDPVGAGLVSDWASHGNENVTGVSDMIVVSDDVELITEIMPGVKKLGTVYNAGESNSVFLVEKLKEACDALGIEVAEATVSTTADVATASQSLVGQVDAIWIGTDNTVVAGLEALVGICENNSIPLFSADDDSIERGCIAAYSFDYYDIGYQTGEMVARILEGEDASKIAVEKGKKISLSLNTAAAERMGISIPQDIIDRAEKTYSQ
ncbi:ABC transporter substrate-binding protein [Chloroflexota bacterium]